jgi:arginine decarboxylase
MDLEAQGVGLPLLLRFSDILRTRIEMLTERFRGAIEEFEYTGGYTTVYPIKVNQQRHVVEEIVAFGRSTTSASRSAASRSCRRCSR